MAVRKILLLGDESLYTVCRKILPKETEKAKQVICDLQDTLSDFQRSHGYGRAIAAPQVGEAVRIICMNLKGRRYNFINPSLELSGELFSLWDDCMSFPGLEVRLNRYKNCTVRYLDEQFRPQVFPCEGDLSELLQHEYDHLDGILAVQRAIDGRSFRMRPDKAAVR